MPQNSIPHRRQRVLMTPSHGRTNQQHNHANRRANQQANTATNNAFENTKSFVRENLPALLATSAYLSYNLYQEYTSQQSPN